MPARRNRGSNVPDVPSTTSGHRTARLSQPPEGTSSSAAGRPPSFRSKPRRNWHDELTVVVRYGGGTEHWVVIKTRGCELRVPGYVAIADVLAAINSRY